MQTENGNQQTEARETPSSIAHRTSMANESLPNSSNSEGPSNDLKRYWEKPTSVSELAHQTNEIANLFLNGGIDAAMATRFSSLARTIAQLKSLEASEAKRLRQPINLNI